MAAATTTTTTTTKSAGPGEYADIQDTTNVIHGIMWPPMISEASLEFIKSFDVREDDVWVATHAKSGTNWCAEICQLVHNNGDLDGIDRKQSPLPIEFELFPEDQTENSNRPPNFEAAANWRSPRTIVSHLPMQFLPREIEQGKGKVIHVIRNPKDVCVSRYYFLLKRRKHGASALFEDAVEEFFYSGNKTYGCWFDYELAYWSRRHDKQFLVLKYEDMKLDTRGAVVQIADFLQRPLSAELIDKITGLVTLKSMAERFYTAKEDRIVDKKGATEKTGVGNLIRKGIVGDWKNHFTVAQNEQLDKLYHEKMKGSGLQLMFQ